MKSIQSNIVVLALGTVLLGIPASVFASRQVISLSNQTTGNTLQVFSVLADGSLSSNATIPTGGIGTGTGLGSQGAIAYDQESGTIAAVNSGDNSISIFRKYGENIRLTSRVSSHGFRPVSVTLRDEVLFVLNQGDANHPSNIQGFNVHDGGAYPISGSSSGLSAAYTNPAQISFAPNGRNLVVTEKGTSLIDVFDVNNHGRISGFHITASNGSTPFGFAFSNNGELFVTEAVNSTVSAYRKSPSGSLDTISASVPDTQGAACWAAVSPNNRFVFAANAHSGTISTYEIGVHGIIDLVGNSTPIPGSTPVDMTLSDNGSTVFLVGSGIPGIVSYHVASNGLLTQVGTVPIVKGSAGIVFAN